MHQQRQRRGLKNSVSNFLKCFQQTTRTLAEPTSSPWISILVTAHHQCKEALYTGTQTLQLGTTGNRELGVSRYHHQKCLTMGQSYCHGFQEVCTWRSTKEENVHRFPCYQCPTAYSGQG